MNELSEKKRVVAKKHELHTHKNIPYLVHITPNVILTEDGDYLQTIRISGASFESADDEQINNWHDRINKLLRSISSENISIWQHLVRREENTYPSGEFPEGFAKNLNQKYAKRVTGHLMMINELYLTIVYRPQTSRIGKAIWGVLSSRNKKASQDERQESLEIIDKVAREIESTLLRYDTEPLGIYKHNGVLFSEPVEFYSFLINGEWDRVALAQAPLNYTISSARPFFGMETVELRLPNNTIYGAMLGINSYPPESHAIFLNSLLSSSFSFVLTQSFSFLHQETAKRKMKLARNRMINSNDDSISQIEEINEALDDIVAKRWVMGDHHFSLFVKGSSIKELTDNIANARSSLSESGITVAREDLALVSAFWAQLPANFKFRPRISAINSLNFSGFAPMHNFPMGRKENNHWGSALTMYITSAKTPYYFSFHASDPTDEDGGTKKDVGHTLVLGPTGSGKTAWIAFNLCMLQKFGATSILFTKDRDTEILIRALGGQFYPITLGLPTGWNPFWLDPKDPKTIPYLNRLVCLLISCVKKGNDGKDANAYHLTINEEKDIAEAISEVMKREIKHRRLGRVLDYLPKNRGGIYERLSQWCYSRDHIMKDGKHAWVFDNPTDTLISTLGSSKTTGFDLTMFLDDPELRTPINMHLFC